jgi:hypothetical protein
VEITPKIKRLDIVVLPFKKTKVKLKTTDLFISEEKRPEKFDAIKQRSSSTRFKTRTNPVSSKAASPR